MKNKEYTAYYQTEIGTVEIIGTATGILSVGFLDNIKTKSLKAPECLEQCVFQLDEYFRGKREEFTVPLILHGTDFQQRVWKALQAIPYGTTVSYKDIAKAVGNAKAVRAVGGANNRNPIGVIVPCHRVIGHDGQLVGYGEGVWRKKWLLEHESK